MRGKMVPVHCAAEVPHGADHSSPASLQSYFIESLSNFRGVAEGGIEPSTGGFLVHVSHDGKLFASAAAIQPSAAALEAGLMEQEQHYPCSAVLP